jgi:O-acetylhomoserine (thiol)-lyase
MRRIAFNLGLLPFKGNQPQNKSESIFIPKKEKNMKPETIAIHSGYESESTTKAVAVPIYQTVAYEFDSAQHGADLFNLDVPGNIYTRLMNPTTDVLEKRVAALEGGVGSLAVSAGSAAINYAILTIAEQGNNIVATPLLYGGTYTLFMHMFSRLGIEVRFAEDNSPESLAKLIDAKTSAVFCESISNPVGSIADIEGIAEMAHKHEVPLIVDNTVATPILVKPIDYGADIVVHSLTKYMGGHGNSLGGIIVDSGRFPWAKYPERFPMMNTPEAAYHGVVYAKDMGEAGFITRSRTVPMRNTGSTLSPFNAFLILQGIETLALRMERHCENALAVANYLESHSQVSSVNYGGLSSSPYYDLAKKYTDGKPSALLSFDIKGGFDAGVRFYDSLKLFKRLVNNGDAKSLAAHPASTTHRQLSESELAAAGITTGTLRLCVGIEHIDDILEDLGQALEKAK